MKAKLMGLLKDEEGQGMVEYGLILGLVSIVAIGILFTMGETIGAKFQDIINALTTDPSGEG